MNPFAAEYQRKSSCLTQNKTKRANEIVFLLLVRDQEVGGLYRLHQLWKRAAATP